MQSHSLSGGNIVKGKMLVLALAGALLFGITAYAHHSFAGTYDLSQQIKVEGKLVQFLFRNPHSFVHIEAPDANGQMQRWAIEWTGGGQLAGSSIQKIRYSPILQWQGLPEEFFVITMLCIALHKLACRAMAMDWP